MLKHLGLRGGTANPITDSTISISDFLDNVKGFLDDILSQDVYDNLQEIRPKTDLKGFACTKLLYW